MIALLLAISLLTLPGPLPADLAKDLKSMELDPPAAKRHTKLHYLYGNEYKLELFVPYIENKGGVYIGVGADQNYSLAAKARPDLIILMDYDEMVVMVHMIHTALLAASDDIDAFIKRYDKDQIKSSLEIIKAAWKDHPKFKRLPKFYLKVRNTLSKVVRTGRVHGRKGKLIYFLSSDDEFCFIRDMARAGRIIPVDGNLLADKTLKNLAELLKKHSLEVQVLYLSNAEQYWKPIPDSFKQNILALPFAENGLIIRTVAWSSEPWSADGYYHYNIQPGRHLQEFLRTWKRRLTVRGLVRKKSKRIRTGISTIGFPEKPKK